MIPRLYIDGPLHSGLPAPLTAEQVHYLKNVLRRQEGDELRLFNGEDGEFAARIVELKKKTGAAQVGEQTRDQEAEPDLVLYFAPVKRGPLETIVQKAVEVGAARLVPVITERTIAPKLNIARLQAIATEAAEQCGRLNVPSVGEPIKFAALLKTWTEDRRLLFCDEAGDEEEKEWGGREGRAEPVLDVLKSIDSKTDGGVEPWAILTGPEGGFSPGERRELRAKSYVTAATLGPRILRADTAAIAALVLWQAALGDWRRS
ncbi:16S rRNA (uracil(1498)-N(3))-methyltransferase [Hyphococcus luteus]|uniref:Ribosomal RNA small subunit methyltransferase E n=1 Tax=Hyphococcus luteus TaxID=2058213 RepID=A0A2S7K7R6_9PROT|nr:16S rRNA (uracil(1498)-N(3))-methyltransferase [Marinicaulis flavus]PQA88533.1 16S rRNA (uracil(1498)-N(3))-methyltransferase [Marinicaulis flavus]